MKAAQFEYCRPGSVRAAVDALRTSGGDGKIIAGGQSLVPVLAMRLGRPSVLVDINRIPGLARIESIDDRTIRVGALVRHRSLVEQRAMPLLSEAASWIGHTAIRTRGTIGGSIAHADPAAELPVVAAAVDANIHVAGAAGTRTLSAAELFIGPLATSLGDSDVLTAVDLPLPTRWGFAELSRRQGDFGLVTVVAAEVDGQIKIAIGGVGPVPVRPREAEEILAGGSAARSRLAEAAKAAAVAVTVGTDIHASAAYRRAMTEEFTRRALEQLTSSVSKGAA
ncbi:FAD binding domain-containing protein [Nocardia pseudovaccinii]|uniref:FAD binding domain-containing protein n=1 Tax=Nocardia pseudovaccinii TaxID=189540 RepID=UPI0007A4EC6C|nr:xanthine dehydrogenase family protein subunit M [Nocardia pseudovaccinii]